MHAASALVHAALTQGEGHAQSIAVVSDGVERLLQAREWYIGCHAIWRLIAVDS